MLGEKERKRKKKNEKERKGRERKIREDVTYDHKPAFNDALYYL